MRLLRRNLNSVRTSQLPTHTQHSAAAHDNRAAFLSRKIAPLSITACQRPRGPIRLAGGEYTQKKKDTKQMCNKSPSDRVCKNYLRGRGALWRGELRVINNAEMRRKSLTVLQPGRPHARRYAALPRGVGRATVRRLARRRVAVNANAS